MGCGSSKLDPQAKEAAARSDKIERRIRHDKRTESRTVKILLLGLMIPLDIREELC